MNRTLAVLLAGLFMASAAMAQEESAYDKAFQLYSRGKYKEAEAEYRKALEECPDSIGANLELGRLLRELDRAGEAIPFLSTAFELAPSLAAASFELGTAHIALKNWDEAEKCLRRAGKQDAKDAYTWWRLGYVLYRKGNLGDAEKYLKRALAVDDDLSEAWLDLGIVFRAKGDGKKALESLRTAVETDPFSLEAYKEYADTVKEFGDERLKAYVEARDAHNMKKYGEADRKIRALIEGEPENTRYQLLLAHILLHQTPPKEKEAIEAYDKALSLDKKAPRGDRFPSALRSFALEGLGIASLLAKDLKKAKESFTAGTKLDKEYPGHFYYLAVVGAREARSSEVYRKLAEVRKRDPDGSWLKRAWEDEEFKIYRDRKEFFEALEGKG